MKHKLIFAGAIMSAVLIGVALGACTVSAGANSPPAPVLPSVSPTPTSAVGTAEYTSPVRFGRYGIQKYTKADYELAMSFQVDGWQDMSVADFNQKLLNVNDETAYHKVEDALLRVIWTLDEKDPNAGFLLGTLRTSVYECRSAHYSACVYDKLPLWDGNIEYIKYADVYGDQVEIASGYGSYNFRYRMADEAKTTVAQRDAFLAAVDKGMQDFLAKQTEDNLKKSATMTKTLKAELERLTQAQGGQLIAVEGCELDYSWDNWY